MLKEAYSLLDTVTKMDDMFAKAEAFKTLTKEYQVPLRTISDKTLLKPAYICHIMRLAKLPEMIRDGYYSNMISLSHLFIIARAKTDDEMIRIYEDVLSNNLTTLQAEELVRASLYNVETSGDKIPEKRSKEFAEVVEEKNEEVHSQIIQTRIHGRLVLEIKGGYKKTTPLLTELMDIIEAHLKKVPHSTPRNRTEVIGLD